MRPFCLHLQSLLICRCPPKKGCLCVGLCFGFHCLFCSCPPGTESRDSGQARCEPCAVGTFREDGMDRCVECVTPNTVTLAVGTANRTSGCVCKPGYFAEWDPSDTVPHTSSSGELCTRCPTDAVNCSYPGWFSI